MDVITAWNDFFW